MSASYSERWSSRYGDVFAESGTLGAAWQAGLVGVTADQIGRGMKSCLDRTTPDSGKPDPWPPGIVEFRNLCAPPPVDHSDDWKAARADPAKMPSPARLQWHKNNIKWIQDGGELPRPGVVEPPAPPGVMSFWDIYGARSHES